MKSDFFERISPLPPAPFFSLSTDVHYAKEIPAKGFFRRSNNLPDTSELFPEESFADVALVWNEDGIVVQANIHRPFKECFFPLYREGDSLELFFDTRDLKTAGFITKFCHHFVILPQKVGEIQAQEVTTFRTEETHPLCDPDDLVVYTEFEEKSYQLGVMIPAHCLHGYDPSVFNRLGFTYRINRPNAKPQHFSLSSQWSEIEKHPSLWASLQLVK